jgi:transposase
VRCWFAPHELPIGAGFHLTRGQIHDLVGADALLPGLEAGALLADKAYDADERVIQPLEQAVILPVIPSRSNRKTPRPYDAALYKARHLIENFFAKLKQFRAIATRYDNAGKTSLLAQLRTRPSITVADPLAIEETPLILYVLHTCPVRIGLRKRRELPI